MAAEEPRRGDLQVAGPRGACAHLPAGLRVELSRRSRAVIAAIDPLPAKKKSG
jgi:hypothetical protein